MDDLVYTKYKKTHANLSNFAKENPSTSFPTLAELQEKQRHELLEIAQVRYGIKGGKVDIVFTPLDIQPNMSEAQVFKVLLTSPEHERADQILYGLAVGKLNAEMANRVLSGLALLGKFKTMRAE
ncbi:hypothetical protein [Polynucleobacter sp. MWH-UH35A]|uniref:hypothetical protein n=1 Tax=Polynucleobacter sp. MWH-UH35A TaxID=1855619 RepID=UPI001BFDAE61|nr:hypothetical protein [Polynucleobacter sp. MWH-UH35A]QWD59713.1 hypothetical protein ICV36_07875 [Polynucleobacter sp. MWH-UH35A]